MIRIHYKTQSGKRTLVAVPDAKQMSNKLESLWKARIRAEAFYADGGEKAGAVEMHPDGFLTWWCWNDEEEAQ